MLGLNGNRIAGKGLFLFDGDCETGQRLPSRRFPLGILRIGLGLLHRRLVEANRNLVVGRIDDHQQVALMDKLVVLDRQLDDLSGDLRRHRHDIDAHRTIASRVLPYRRPTSPGRAQRRLRSSPG